LAIMRATVSKEPLPEPSEEDSFREMILLMERTGV
jgi:hypothetical protein